jgi:DNA-binding ferritin-like protein
MASDIEKIEDKKSPSKEQIGKAVAEMADIMATVSGNFHILHHNYKGDEFDNFHKKVCLKYYEAAADDYDDLTEWSCAYDLKAQNVNQAAERCDVESLKTESIGRSEIQGALKKQLETITENMTMLYGALNKIDDCPISIGVCNMIQTRLEYWSKEAFYFNARR